MLPCSPQTSSPPLFSLYSNLPSSLGTNKHTAIGGVFFFRIFSHLTQPLRLSSFSSSPTRSTLAHMSLWSPTYPFLPPSPRAFVSRSGASDRARRRYCGNRSGAAGMTLIAWLQTWASVRGRARVTGWPTANAEMQNKVEGKKLSVSSLWWWH